MIRTPLIIVVGLLLGVFVGIGIIKFSPWFHSTTKTKHIKPEVLGFLPYALLSRAKTDYSSYITTLAYFSLQIDTDGSIVKLANAQEEDPGWYHLQNGDAAPFLSAAKNHHEKLSLTVFSGNNDTIDALVSDPVTHAHNLTHDVIPVMRKFGFSDLNLDIESTKQATDGAQRSFTTFTQTVKNDLSGAGIESLSVDISTVDLLKHDLINPQAMGQIADKVIIMGYDFHSTASFVTGPIAPVGGAGTESEYDVASAVLKAKDVMPAQKIVLGSPLYGYEWETLMPAPRAGVIPNSGLVASNRRTEDMLKSCSNCTTTIDAVAQEPHVSYFDSQTDTYHQIFYPDKNSMQAKVALAQQDGIGGLALWALGYEGSTVMNPLKEYIRN